MSSYRPGIGRLNLALWAVRSRVLVLVLLALLVLPLPAAAQEPPPDLQTYELWLREARNAAQRNDRLGLEQVAEQLTQTRSVALPDGTLVPVDNQWLGAELERADPNLSIAASRLGAILDALAQPDSVAPDDAVERLDRILTNPPFQRDDLQDQNWNWLNDLLNWIGRVLENLIRPIDAAAGGTGSIIGWTLGAISLLLLLGIIGYLLLGLRRNLVQEAQTADDDPEANLTARTALNQASDLARDGDYRTAVRYLYLSALLWLDERDMLRYDRALTNREYLERVRDNPALRERLSPIVETFDRVWYGHAQLDAESFAAYRAQVEALRNERTG